MDDSRRCTAKSKRSGERCKRPASPGYDKCYIHIGVRRDVRKATGEVVAMNEAARRAVETYGLPRDISPTDALLEEVRYSAGHVAWLRAKVAEIEADDLVWGKTEEVDKNASEFAGTDTTHAAAVNVWLDLYFRERKHLLDLTKTAISVGIEERRVRLAEAQGAVLVQVIRSILDDLDLSAEQQARVSEVVPRRLRAVAG